MRSKPFLQNLKDYVGFTDGSTQLLQAFHDMAAPHQRSDPRGTPAPRPNNT